jgi:hypothetical protein
MCVKCAYLRDILRRRTCGYCGKGGGWHCLEVCHVQPVVLLLPHVVLHPSLYYYFASQSAPNSVLHSVSPLEG